VTRPSRLPEEQKPRVVVCGGRDYADRDRLFRELDRLLRRLKDPIICTGAAKGADALAEQWAYSRMHTVKRFHADWDKYGKSAGPRRNEQMIDFAAERRPAFCVAFPGGPGTADCVRQARAAGLIVRIVGDQ
jgi:predicted Rossmann-fold nucleotide-binding protein